LPKKKLLKSQFFKSENVFIRHVGQTLLLVKNVNAKMLKKNFFARDTIGKDGIVCPGTRGTW